MVYCFNYLGHITVVGHTAFQNRQVSISKLISSLNQMCFGFYQVLFGGLVSKCVIQLDFSGDRLGFYWVPLGSDRSEWGPSGSILVRC